MRARVAQSKTRFAATGAGAVLVACSTVQSFADVPGSDIVRAAEIGARDVVPIEVTEADGPDYDCLPRITGRYCPPQPDVPMMPADASLQPVPDAGPSLPAPRLTGPVSPLGVASWRPRLHWELPAGATGAVVDHCRDRNCTRPIMRFEADGSESRPPDPIPPGVVFWRAYARDARGVSTNVSRTWEFWVRRRDTPSDAPWGVYRDFNGDGYEDVAIPAARGPTPWPMDDGTYDYSMGVVYVYYGGPCGIDGRPPDVLRRRGRSVFGDHVEYAGDFDGDGYADLLMSETIVYSDGFSRWRVAFGSAEGLNLSRSEEIAIPLNLTATIGFNRRNAVLDFDGDGFTDIAFSQFSILLVPGDRARRSSPVEIWQPATELWMSPTVSPQTALSQTQGTATGSAILLALHGTTRDSWQHVVGGYHLTTARTLEPDWQRTVENTNYRRLFSLQHGGDFEADAMPDVVYGGELGVSVYSRVTPGSLWRAYSLQIPAEVRTATRDHAGRGLWGFDNATPVLDTNGDGATEVTIGAACALRPPPDPYNVCGDGRLYLYAFDPAATDTAIAPTIALSGTTRGSEFGFSASGADLNGDGFDDLIVAAPGDSVMGWRYSRYAGSVVVYWGGSDRVSSSRTTVLDGCFPAGVFGGNWFAYN